MQTYKFRTLGHDPEEVSGEVQSGASTGAALLALQPLQAGEDPDFDIEITETVITRYRVRNHNTIVPLMTCRVCGFAEGDDPGEARKGLVAPDICSACIQ